MFKKLDILIIRSFIGPFIVTFFITLFVLVMQFFWLYMDELIGKGLGPWMIFKLLALMSTTLVPLALPLGILLASIMTFGSMGENMELVAIKSAGISLLRFMRPLVIVISLIGALAFLFNNNVIPVANLKALSLLYDLRNANPSFNIRAGQFNNEIKGFSIRVGSKDKDGKTIRDIMIYDNSGGIGNEKLVLAEWGKMMPSPDKQFLVFRLHNGWRYEEGSVQNGTIRTQTRMHFEQWDKVFDLSAFKVSRTDEELFKGAYQMMNVAQLTDVIRDTRKEQKQLGQNVARYLGGHITPLSAEPQEGPRIDSLISGRLKQKAPVRAYDSSFLELIPAKRRAALINTTNTHIRNLKFWLDANAQDYMIKEENLLKSDVEWHRKFTLSFACVLLFLIGAPLGSIIRKGGLGMPVVIAIAFFIVWYIISITGEKLAKTGSLPAWVGMWMATVMLLPIAVLLIRQARNDSKIFNREWYMRAFGRIAGLWTKGKHTS